MTPNLNEQFFVILIFNPVGALYKTFSENGKDEPNLVHCQLRGSVGPMHGLLLCQSGRNCLPPVPLFKPTVQETKIHDLLRR